MSDHERMTAQGRERRLPISGAKHNLYVGDAARLVCKQLTLISSILKHEHWGFLVSLVIGCPSFCLIFSVLR